MNCEGLWTLCTCRDKGTKVSSIKGWVWDKDNILWSGHEYVQIRNKCTQSQ